MCGAMLWPTGTLLAAPFLEFADPNPAAGNQFGLAVVRTRAPSTCSPARRAL
jgi:hypothetical protein